MCVYIYIYIYWRQDSGENIVLERRKLSLSSGPQESQTPDGSLSGEINTSRSTSLFLFIFVVYLCLGVLLLIVCTLFLSGEIKLTVGAP